MPAPLDLRATLAATRTIAVVGCSDHPGRTSYAIAAYLQAAGYRILPINPHHDAILGERCYPDLAAVPEDVQIDLVNIFRRPEHTEAMVAQAIERAAQTGTTPLLWTQLGVSSPAAQRRAEAAGLPYVADRCLMIVHRQLLG